MSNNVLPTRVFCRAFFLRDASRLRCGGLMRCCQHFDYRSRVMSGTSDITKTYSKEGGGRRRLRLPRLRPALPAPAPTSTWRQEVGGSSPESALGVGPRLPQHEPGDLDTRDSGGENEPTFMGRANPGPFLNAVPDLSGIGTSRDLSGVTPPMLFRASVR